MSQLNETIKRTRPQTGGEKSRFDNIAIEFTQNAVLDEGVVYIGDVTDCYVWINSENGNQTLKVDITLDDDGGVYESYHKCPLHKWSPLTSLLAELQTDLKRKVVPSDLVGNVVEFSIKYNQSADGKEHCNIKKINFVYDDIDESDVDDDSDDNDYADDTDSDNDELDVDSAPPRPVVKTMTTKSPPITPPRVLPHINQSRPIRTPRTIPVASR